MSPTEAQAIDDPGQAKACALPGNCPLCGAPNRCRLETGEGYKGPCWCERPTVSAAALMLVAHGLSEVRSYGETILYRGGSLTARYLEATMRELEGSLRGSGFIADSVWTDAMSLFRNDAFWSWQNSYVTSIGRKPVA